MRIIDFGQIVNLERGTEIVHQITVESETGQRRQIRTDEGTVQQLIELLSGNEPLAPPAYYVEPSEELDSEDVFGGDYDPGETLTDPEPESVMGVISEETAAVLPAIMGGLGQPRTDKLKRPLPVDSEGFYLPVRARTVPKDEMGYPIVQHRSAVSSVPDDDGEEDGTQI